VTTSAAWQIGVPPIHRFVEASSADERLAKVALEQIAAGWKDSYAAMFVDMARLMRPSRRNAPTTPADSSQILDDERSAPGPERPFSDPADSPDRGSPIRRRLVAFLEKQTGHRFGDDLTAWRNWMWKLPYHPHPEYAAFKALVYGQIDPRMRAFFPPGVQASIRLDEIDWGGVLVNGIPPLRDPKILSVADATYLKDSNVVFGLVANGEARAYPKRILAWHEMATDRVGGVDLTIVYCTLCGTVIPFESRVNGRSLHFGTSGLLYRSNKLMFDEETSSLWSTFEGVPVVGSLVGSGVRLQSHAVVTTTWKEWRTEHPDTRVLSLDTGYTRDYSEGAAYRDYFSTDRLMFHVSKIDARLRNKAEVLVMQLGDETTPGRRVPVAIDTQFLRKHRVYTFTVAHERFVAVTTESGANRVFRVEETFPEQAVGPTILDNNGGAWRVTESGLVLARDSTTRRPRVAAQRAFWFGWYAQFPETILIK
jgi:hypothetical protein